MDDLRTICGLLPSNDLGRREPSRASAHKQQMWMEARHNPEAGGATAEVCPGTWAYVA